MHAHCTHAADALHPCRCCAATHRHGAAVALLASRAPHAPTQLPTIHTFTPPWPLPFPPPSASRKARIVANPGCYPTSVQLPLVPLLEAGLISHEDIIIDAKSGGCSGCCLVATSLFN